MLDIPTSGQVLGEGALRLQSPAFRGGGARIQLNSEKGKVLFCV